MLKKAKFESFCAEYDGIDFMIFFFYWLQKSFIEAALTQRTKSVFHSCADGLLHRLNVLQIITPLSPEYCNVYLPVLMTGFSLL